MYHDESYTRQESVRFSKGFAKVSICLWCIMDYGLARRLKDFGFPQPKCNDGDGYYDYGDDLDQQGVYVPTLTELIESCGDIDIEFIGTPVHGYEARSLKIFKFQTVMGKGKDAEEAFAHLWLALHKPDKSHLVDLRRAHSRAPRLWGLWWGPFRRE